MNLESIAYYLFNLIKEGHYWQRQNATNTNEPKKWYAFNALQYIALALALIFICTNKSGINTDIIDFLLSSLSIMTGLFFATIVLVYDKFRTIEFTDLKTEEEKVNSVKYWSYLSQFNALISYAILIALMLIIILIGSLLFGHNTDLTHVFFTWSNIDIPLTLQVVIVLAVRFILVYFLFDFIILAVYSICSLFQLIHLDMLNRQPTYKINKKIVEDEYLTLNKKFGVKKCHIITGITIPIILLILYKSNYFLDVLKNIYEYLKSLLF